MAALPSLTTISPGNSPVSIFSWSPAVLAVAGLVPSADDSAGVRGGLVAGVWRGSMDLSPRLSAALRPKLHPNVRLAECVQEGCK